MPGGNVSSTQLAVQAHGITKKFGDFTAVDNLDLEVQKGTVFSLLGPNGAGKTTVVRMLSTLIKLDGGNATVCGSDVATQPDLVRQRIALTGQFAALDPNLSVSNNLLLVAKLRGHRADTAKSVVADLIDRFEISDYAEKLVKDISGGQRRRGDLAASLVSTPELLVLDEPTTGLDPRSRQIIWKTVRELVGDGVTVLLTTQYLEEADALADQIVMIDHGRRVAAGTPTQLKDQIGEQRVDVVAVDAAGLEQLKQAFAGRFEVSVIESDKTISIPAPNRAQDLSEVSAAIQQAGIEVDEIALRRPTLDDAFLQLTGQPAHQAEEVTDANLCRTSPSGHYPSLPARDRPASLAQFAWSKGCAATSFRCNDSAGDLYRAIRLCFWRCDQHSRNPLPGLSATWLDCSDDFVCDDGPRYGYRKRH